MARLSESQRKLFNALHNSRLEDFKVFDKSDYRGVWSSIVDKYPESAHFVYELLQNADDAEATEVHIILQRDRMLFKHNGRKHFDITKENDKNVGDINSITGIGDSSKATTQNKIGKFGVGFKAVFQYTDTPEIYDDYFKFKIEHYIVPTLLSCDHPWREEGETLFVFPFKDKARSYQDISGRLETLQNPILFLRNLQRIVWRIDNKDGSQGQNIVYSKEILNTVKFENDGITLEHYRLHDASRDSEIILFSEKVIINVDGKKDEHLINVGYFYDPKKKALITDEQQNIYCFFPTKETFKTCFVSHAPFLLTDNRQNLKPNEQLNKSLVNLLSKLAAQAIVYLRDYKIEKDVFLINENITEIIPQKHWRALDETFELPIYDAFKNILKEERLLLSRNNKYLSLCESYIGTPRELVDLIDQKQLVLLKKDALEDYYDEEEDLYDVNKIDFLKWELSQNILKQGSYLYEEISRYESKDFAQDIDVNFMKVQELKWVTKMYTFLRTAASKLWKITDKNPSAQAKYLPFRKAPIVKTQKGDWVPPFIDGIAPNVFLPLKDDCKSDYNFISKEYLENDMAKKFFKELDIQEPNERDYIRQVILEKFEGQDIEVEDDDLQSDFEVLIEAFLRIKKNSDKADFVKLLKEKLYLCGKDEHLHRPADLYMYNKNLFAYLNKGYGVFFDIDFYNSAVKKYGEDVVLDFVERLGVRKYPHVNEIGRYSVYALNERIRKQISTAEYQHYNISDYELEGFAEFCQSEIFEKPISVYLWNVVLPAIEFGNYAYLKIEYKRKYARNWEKKGYISTFKDDLIHNDWLIDIYGNEVSPLNVAMEDLAPEYDRNNGLIQFLGIEKREKSIVELGGTEEQQQDLDFAKQARRVGKSLTDEEKLQAIAKAEAEKNGSFMSADSNGLDDKEIVQAEEETRTHNKKSHVSVEPYNEEEKEDELTLITENESKSRNGNNRIEPNGTHQNDGYANDQDDEPEYSESVNYDFSRKEMKRLSPNEMFVQSPRKPSTIIVTETTSTNEDNVDNLMQDLIEHEEKRNRINELREIAQSSEKYTKEWFDALIELESRGKAEIVDDTSSKSIRISFSSVCKEPCSERIYIFNNPSRNVPLWLEEIGDIEVKCAFSNREELKITFEVANVRDNCLRLKSSKAYEKMLNMVEWNKCTKASITLKNQIDLMSKLRTAFNDLEFDDYFNLKENLEDNIEFIFGPPGTGKTTTLAKKIISQMEESRHCKILVLAPTNTACDELARKIQENSHGKCSWLSRFVSTADESLEDIVIDRDSLAYKEKKCCIISTIARLSFDGFSGTGGYNRLSDIVWDMVICDEASMIPLAEIALAIYTFTNTPILIAGDPMQIKPILHEEQWKDENIYTMVKLDRFEDPVTEPIQFKIDNLTLQYRSVPAIGELFSQYAYDGKLRHYRSALTHPLTCGELELKPINFIPFKVERYDSIFGIKKLDGSNVHIYSALLTVEMLKYIIKHYPSGKKDDFSIGVVCPYSPQAQLIESLVLQIPDIPTNVKVVVGTVHRFQGGQCNLMFVVLNPPLGIKNASNRIFLNNKNILNVAISRAQDNLCVLLPHSDTDGYENLYEINNIGTIATRNSKDVASYTCDQIEEILFSRKFFIENNTFVTSHQLANVYSRASKRYEVRIDEKSVDIQLGSVSRGYTLQEIKKTNLDGDNERNSVSEDDAETNACR